MEGDEVSEVYEVCFSYGPTFLREVRRWSDHRILSSPRCSFWALSGGFSTPFGSCRSNDRAGWTHYRHAAGDRVLRVVGALATKDKPANRRARRGRRPPRAPRIAQDRMHDLALPLPTQEP